MSKKNSPMTQYAMKFGLVLAAYYIIKFFISVMTLQYFYLNIVNMVLILGIPFVLYKLVTNYRDTLHEGEFSFSNAFSLSLLLIFFASLPEAMCQYIYFEWINPHYIDQQVASTMAMLEKLAMPETEGLIGETLETLESSPTPSAVQMTFQGIFNNLYGGGIVSLVIALITKRKEIAQ